MSAEAKNVITKIELDWNGNVLSKDSEPYFGPWALCEGEEAVDSGGDGDSVVPQADLEAADEDESSVGADDDGEKGDDKSDGPPDWEGVLKFLDEAGKLDAKPDKDDDFDAPEDLSEDASKRFQTLANSNRDMKQRLSQYEQHIQQANDYTQRVIQAANQQIERASEQNVQLQNQMNVLLQQVQALMSGGHQEEDGADKLQQEWLEKGKNAFQEQLRPLQEKLESLEREKIETEKTQRIKREADNQRQKALTAAEKNLSMLTEADRKEVMPIFAPLALAVAINTGTDVETGAQTLHRVFCKFAAGMLRSGSKGFKDSQARGKKAATVTKKGRRANVKSDGVPSEKELEEKGLDALDFMIKSDLNALEGR